METSKIPDSHLSELESCAKVSKSPSREAARSILDETTDLEKILAAASIPRLKFFGRMVQIHVLDNVQNGNCPEDCGYCAQRKSEAAADIPDYPRKSIEEILEEARVAYESGAYRFCLVTSGRGPGAKSVAFFAEALRKIREKYDIRTCLSAGIMKNPEFARQLKEAGLDRYNHNLNTSERHYGEICTTHTFQDRVETLNTMRDAGISLCSGVIVGLGESCDDLVSMAYDLKAQEVESIPVNFFLPVPGHEISHKPMSADFCLRVLSLFRLVNPGSEIRMAAGREFYLRDLQKEALRVANSLFVSGYLNIKGSEITETFRMIQENGWLIDTQKSDLPNQLQAAAKAAGFNVDPSATETLTDAIAMKSIEDLRPFERKNS